MKNKTWKKWSEEELIDLDYAWRYDTMQNLMKKFPARSYASLMLKAKALGIKSEINRSRRGSMKFLDELNPSSVYWWGFIMADGHLSRSGELTITLSIKDLDHLQKLRSHLMCSIYERTISSGFNNLPRNVCTLRLGDKRFANKWLDILELDNPKTYTPPNLDIFMTPELFIYFFIGISDGDSSIWKSKNWLNYRLELHGNWFNTLVIMSKKLNDYYGIISKVKLSNRGYAQLNITKKQSFIILKQYFNSVDYMERKWSNLDHLQTLL